MELSARDKRILADIECESSLDDPHWVRRFERLGRHGTAERRGMRRRRLGFGAMVALVLTAWVTGVVLGAILLRPVLWATLALGAAGLTALIMRRRRVYGYWYRPRPRISRIPRQNPPGRSDGAENSGN